MNSSGKSLEKADNKCVDKQDRPPDTGNTILFKGYTSNEDENSADFTPDVSSEEGIADQMEEYYYIIDEDSESRPASEEEAEDENADFTPDVSSEEEIADQMEEYFDIIDEDSESRPASEEEAEPTSSDTAENKKTDKNVKVQLDVNKNSKKKE